MKKEVIVTEVAKRNDGNIQALINGEKFIFACDADFENVYGVLYPNTFHYEFISRNKAAARLYNQVKSKLTV